MPHHARFPGGVVAGDDVRPGLLDQPEVEGQVVNRRDLQSQQLVDLDQVMQVGFAVERVDVGVPVGIDGREVILPFLVAHVDRPEAGEQLPVAPVAGRHDAIEHVDAPLNRLQDIDGRTDTHQVARLVFGQHLVDDLDHLVHLFGRLTYGEAADRVPVGPFAGHVLGRLDTKILVDTTLHDGEEALRIAIFGLRLVETLEATVEPALRQAQRLLCVVVVGVARATLVEGHDDVRADRALDIHHLLGREEVLRPVDVRAELGALLVQLAIVGKGEDLETTAVGQYGSLPTVELMQSADLFQDMSSWAEVKMIGVSEDDLRLDIVSQLGDMDTFHRPLRADRHEDGGFNEAMIGRDQARSRVRFGIVIL